MGGLAGKSIFVVQTKYTRIVGDGTIGRIQTLPDSLW